MEFKTERNSMKRFKIFFIFLLMTAFNPVFLQNLATAEEEPEVKTQEIVGNIVSTNKEASSFDLEIIQDDMTKQKQLSTFYLTDISTIDIAMSQGSLADLTPGLKVLVEYAPMPDGTNVVEAVWVKK